MALKRIKGQEVNVRIVRDGKPTPIGVVQDNTITVDIERLEEEYLGETGMRYDSIYNGTQFEGTLHLDSAEIFEFMQAVKLRAENRAGGALRIDVAVVYRFPSGVVRTFVLIDCESGELPIESASRKDYVSVKVDFKTSTIKII